ncbi:MAG: DUF928 domain-containing protein [Symploca sp. SIO3C6]|uniref:DUF928 domain-containing protein n=1 Tax=Symploca sp. SIO1C4 TaxID=2607765 RepID=A0A6B3NJ81_9CYAN|nr:DUF928 domain-containing protein [Symploca sp. SIO3C6]NER31800.1 DUF928 domain-containing protein [Symploca sp. SIO1C4]NET08357.1 DUF928 domain-containing protein [Symploca sp. SIO2B6]NET52485.1 DUF928 domain-containing protein [Merismopedia sp. SIO2A8]
MTWFTRSSRFIILVVVLTGLFVVNIQGKLQAQLSSSPRSELSTESAVDTSSQLRLVADVPVSRNDNKRRWNFSNWDSFKPATSGSGVASNRQAGATRGNCVQGQQTLTALVPASGLGATFDEYPTLSWYMPETSASALELVLLDSQNQEIYSTKHTLAKSSEGIVSPPGVMSLNLPAFANLSPLEIDQEYQWQLSLTCNSQDPSADVIVEGIIQRVPLDPILARRLKWASPQERIDIYATNGVWYDALGTTLALKRDRPRDQEIKAAWEELLESVGLQKIAPATVN